MIAVIERAPSWFDPAQVIPKFSEKKAYRDAVRAGAVALQREVHVHFDNYRGPSYFADLLLARDTARREHDRLRACGIEVPELDWYPRRLPEGPNDRDGTLQLIVRVPVIEGEEPRWGSEAWEEYRGRCKLYEDSTEFGALLLTDLRPEQLIDGLPREGAKHSDARPYLVDVEPRFVRRKRVGSANFLRTLQLVEPPLPEQTNYEHNLNLSAGHGQLMVEQPRV
jgi:hypothetical protein